MATWQLGPFDNDDAVEWCAALESADPGQRLELVRHTLETAIIAGPTLTVEGAAQAIAAAATVLQSLTGVPPSDSAYAPRFLLDRDDIPASPSLRALAGQALDTTLAEGSTWRLRWADDIEEEDALAAVEDLRTKLSRDP
ncbi:DUF4259 domain-containing protein [Micromonospora sp. HM134]|uniref:DUF4259 domain-containing protein n=1 Tax=Micromonospora sp. HM134 TaxID=2583243 RepID=UPI0011985194|nr:DUF4259 domain-containing protein [Micromonospora sp. HM134]QDY11139.1 DUF4259 domain-containing protein [Micromonospora sp. HM134]